MKKIITVFAVFLLLFTSIFVQAGNKKEKTIVFKVDMDCHGCKVKIEDNISYEKGVTDLKVNLEEKLVEITYREDKTSMEQIVKAFAKIGYKAEPADSVNGISTATPQHKKE
jgi:copper chaperone CopZ